MAMRRDPMFLTVALSSALLFLAAGHAQAQGSRTYVLRSGVVTVSATGSGTVSSSEGSIRCPATCTATYNSGTSVTLTASPDIGSVFGGWSGCDTVADTTCTVTMSAARSVTAAFNAQP